MTDTTLLPTAAALASMPMPALLAQLRTLYADTPTSWVNRLLRHIEDLEAQLAAVGAGGVEPLRRRGCLHQIEAPVGESLAQVAQHVIEEWKSCGEWPDTGDEYDRITAAITALRKALDAQYQTHTTITAQMDRIASEQAQRITVLEQAARQALAMLEFPWDELSDVISTLRKALEAELKPPAVESKFNPRDDAERLKSVARGMSYNDVGETVWKHTLMEIAMRLETGGYATHQYTAVTQEPAMKVHFDVQGWRKVIDALKSLRDGTPLYTALQPVRYRTDREIVDQTVELANRLLAWKHNLVPESGAAPIWDSPNPLAQECWQMACEMQETLTQTDVENALAEIEGCAA